MVSRNSAFALTVMLLVSASSQASWLPSMPSLPSLPSFSLPSFVNKENGKFVAAVAASLVVLDLTKKAAAKLWATSVDYTPACVKEHATKAHATAYSYLPERFKSAPVAPKVCPVQEALVQVTARVTRVEKDVELLDSTVFPNEEAKRAASDALRSRKAADAKRAFEATAGAAAGAAHAN